MTIAHVRPRYGMSAELARETPLGFLLYAKPRYRWAPHLDLVNRRILETICGSGKRRLLISEPPRHAKSTVASIATPAWYLGTFPDRVVVGVSHGQKLSNRFSRHVRSLVEEHGRRTHDVEVSEASSAAHEWMIAGHGGGMIAVGIGGSLTGSGAHLLVIDDPIKDAKQAHSKTWRDETWEWVLGVAEERLEPDAAVILCMTRWHEDDMAGRFLDQQPGDWEELRLPALAEEDDALGRQSGEALWPERYDVAALEKIRARVGSYYWNAEFQQRPAPEEGMTIKRSWWKHYDVLPSRFDQVITSWDMTFKETADGSRVSGQRWGRRGAEFYLLPEHELRRMDFVETKRAVVALSRKEPAARAHLIEDAANGPAVISELKKVLPGIIPVAIGGKHGSKAARLAAVSPLIEAGNVYLPRPSRCPWVDDFIDELAAFPNGEHDDQVDTCSQALAYLSRGAVASVVTSAPVPRENDRRAPPAAAPTGRIGRVPLWGD